MSIDNPAIILFALVGIGVLFYSLPKFVWWLFSFDQKVQDILHQKKSSEVRVGQLIETVAPFLEDFPVDVQKEGTSTIFIGQPVDFIHFDPDEGVTFIEVKSGNSKLSDSQKQIKALVEAQEVFWEEFRIKGD